MMRRVLPFLLSPLAALAITPPVAQMKSQTPKIILAWQTKGGEVASASGSGFFVDSRHIVTNWHVCCNLPEDTVASGMVAGRAKDDVIKGKAIWNSQTKDLAVIELEKPENVTPVTFAGFPSLSEGMDVWAVGYPGAAGRMSKGEGVFRASLTKGVISKMDTRAVQGGEAPVRLIQTDASINAGNSGGPLFDSCGRVVAVNVTKALVTVLDSRGQPVRVPEADGIGWSVDIRELLPELDKLGIKYKTFDNPCELPSSSSGTSYSSVFLGVQIFLAIATIGAGAIMMKRKVVPAVVTRMARSSAPTASPRAYSPSPAPAHRPPPTPPAAPAAPARPFAALVGLSGEYAGQHMPISEKGLILGRDAAVSNVVFSSSTGISKRHCRVYPENGRLYVEDTFSSNGTFMRNGMRLASGKPYELQPGDEIRLADGQTSFRVEPI